MVLPNLIHPMSVIVEIHDASEQEFDSKDPMHSARSSSSVTIQAQVKWGRQDLETMETAGERELSDGYILVRKYDMDALSVNFKNGDKIVAIGWQTGLVLFIIMAEPVASYPDQQGPSLIKYHFQDRKPDAGTAQVE